MDKKLHQTTNSCVAIMNSRRQAKGKLGHMVKFTFAVLRKRDASTLLCLFTMKLQIIEKKLVKKIISCPQVKVQMYMCAL